MKCLVTYYSMTGRTRKVAESIAGSLKCDIEEITEQRKRGGVIGFLRSGYEATRKKLPPINDPRRSPGEYDLVIIGTPVWSGTMSSPVRTFLAEYGAQVKKAACFCTAWSSEDKLFGEMEAFLKEPAVATLFLRAKQIRNKNLFRGEAMNRINDFSESVRNLVPAGLKKKRAPSGAKPKARKAKPTAKKTKKTGSTAKLGTKKPGAKNRTDAVRARTAGSRKTGTKSRIGRLKTRKTASKKKSSR